MLFAEVRIGKRRWGVEHTVIIPRHVEGKARRRRLRVTRPSLELNDSTLDTEDERRRVDVVAVEEVESTEAADEIEDFREGHSYTARLIAGSFGRRVRTCPGIVIARLTVGRVNGEMSADC
jgi:hypothetical protein